MVVGIGTTVSRGSWVSCGVTLTLLFGVLATFRAYRLPALALMVVIVVGSAFFVTRTDYFKERFRSVYKEGHIEWDTRELLWRSTLLMWKDNNRWVGVGPGHFNYRWREYRPADIQKQPDRAHNEYLNLLADYGVVGAAIVGVSLVIFYMGVIRSWRYVRRDESDFRSSFSNKFALVLGGTLGLTAVLAHSVTDFNLQIPANAILAVTLVALVSSHLRFASEKYWLSIGRMTKPLLTVFLMAGTVLFLHQFFRLGREYLWLERAEIQSPFSDEQIYARSNAWRIEPRNFETAFGIGKSYRVQSNEGGENYGELATNAMVWFSRGTNCNPFDERNYLGLGWSLDWVHRFDEARPFFFRADALDRNGYYTAAEVAGHYRATGDFAAARTWAERSRKLNYDPMVNRTAAGELYLANRELLRNAFEPPLMPSAPPRQAPP
jgi:hypothetical protein